MPHILQPLLETGTVSTKNAVMVAAVLGVRWLVLAAWRYLVQRQAQHAAADLIAAMGGTDRVVLLPDGTIYLGTERAAPPQPEGQTIADATLGPVASSESQTRP